MLENFWYLMNTVRTEILEKFIIPGIGISYWKFLIYLAVAGVVITVLVNAVRYTASESVSRAPSAPNYKPSKNSRPESSISLWARGGGKPPPMGLR